MHIESLTYRSTQSTKEGWPRTMARASECTHKTCIDDSVYRNYDNNTKQTQYKESKRLVTENIYEKK